MTMLFRFVIDGWCPARCWSYQSMSSRHLIDSVWRSMTQGRGGLSVEGVVCRSMARPCGEGRGLAGTRLVGD